MCRRVWWKEHPDQRNLKKENFVKHICVNCGKYFTTYGMATVNRKYCSHDCYINDRFHSDKKSKRTRACIDIDVDGVLKSIK